MPRAADPRPDPAAHARAAGLRYVVDGEPGLLRVRDGAGFRYVDAHGGAVADEDMLERIRHLAIPPAYETVWICADERGHLQATGRDARGRKQYRYHARWRTTRDHGKFARMVEFGEALPRLRRRLARDLQLPGLPRDKVLALVVSLIDRTRSRVGNVEYARANGSYGLTTLQDRHVEFDGADRTVIRYRGKAGKEQELAIDDAQLTRLVRDCRRLPGRTLFQYLDDAGARQRIDSGMVNEYLRTVTGRAFTAKDFRTFGGTLLAVELMSATARPEGASERALAAHINRAIRAVAAELGNTPAVARRSYIHPEVLASWRRGELVALVGARRRGLSRAESMTLEFLRRTQQPLPVAAPRLPSPGVVTVSPRRRTLSPRRSAIRRASPPNATRAPAAGARPPAAAPPRTT